MSVINLVFPNVDSPSPLWIIGVIMAAIVIILFVLVIFGLICYLYVRSAGEYDT